MSRLRLGTRGSALALWQANAVAAGVRGRSGRECELVVITTTGDRLREANLSKVGGKRVFVKEIEQALAGGDIDLAVHSAKDMPAELPDGLAIAAVLPRADPRDAVVRPAGADRPPELSAAESGGDGDGTPRVGSGSVRRVAQLRRAWPLARFRLVRGNVGTRLRKLDAGDYDLLVLAVAGLERLGLADRISMPLDPDVCLPAPGQGIVAVETRAGDADTGDALAAIDDAATRGRVHGGTRRRRRPRRRVSGAHRRPRRGRRGIGCACGRWWPRSTDHGGCAARPRCPSRRRRRWGAPSPAACSRTAPDRFWKPRNAPRRATTRSPPDDTRADARVRVPGARVAPRVNPRGSPP